MNVYVKTKELCVVFVTVLILYFLTSAALADSSATVAPTDTKQAPAMTENTPSAKAVASAGKISRNSIGCILPLSGKYSEWGKKTLDAIMLSAGLFNQKKDIAWQVYAEDSQSLPERTKSAVENLANVKKVIAIIAITETAEALETAREANQWKVPIIIITPREGITSAGEYVFQHFLTPSQQLRALAKYAIDDLNCAIFAALYPQDEYGEEMVNIFRKEAARAGGKVEKVIAYGKKQTDFRNEINSLTDSIVKPPVKPRADTDEEQEIVPVDFEALFIPDSYLRVKLITSQLDFYNVKGFALLGTSLWNSPNLLKDGATYLENAVFADSFFKDGLYPETYMFVDAYKDVYKRAPESIEALAFDSAGLIFSRLENDNVRTREELVAALKNMGIYNGATGNFYFDANRVAQKTPFLLRVKEGKIEQIR